MAESEHAGKIYYVNGHPRVVLAEGDVAPPDREPFKHPPSLPAWLLQCPREEREDPAVFHSQLQRDELSKLGLLRSGEAPIDQAIEALGRLRDEYKKEVQRLLQELSDRRDELQKYRRALGDEQTDGSDSFPLVVAQCESELERVRREHEMMRHQKEAVENLLWRATRFGDLLTADQVPLAELPDRHSLPSPSPSARKDFFVAFDFVVAANEDEKKQWASHNDVYRAIASASGKKRRREVERETERLKRALNRLRKWLDQRGHDTVAASGHIEDDYSTNADRLCAWLLRLGTQYGPR